MEYIELLKSFGAKVGLDDLEPMKDGIFSIEIDNMIVSFVEVPESRQLFTWADVGEQPPEGRERLYRVLMASMHMGKATGGSFFSIDASTGNVTLSRIDSLLLLDLDSFTSMLERFVNVLEKWRHLLSEYRNGASDVESAAEVEQEESLRMVQRGFMQV